MPAQRCTYIDSLGVRHPGTLGTWPAHYVVRRRDGAFASDGDGAVLWYLDHAAAEIVALRYHGGTVVDGGAYDE